MATDRDIAKLIAKLSAAYPNWNPNEFTSEIYFQDLQDIPADVLEAACQHCRTTTARDQRFAPSAGEIRAAAADIKRQAQGVPSPIQAWAELFHVPVTEETRELIEENGENVILVKPYQWSHPLVSKVAHMMGFPKFPDWNSESYERTAFLKVYEQELQSYLKQENQPPQVANLIENKSAQLEAGKPIKQLTKGMTK